MSGPAKFFVKDGYECRVAAATHAREDAPEYWTPERLRKVAAYQHHVYTLAARIARRRGLRKGLDIGCGPATKSAGLLAPVLDELVLVDQPACAGLVAKTMPGARFLPADLETCTLDLPGSFDLIICADVLEHLLDPRACLAFARSRLARNGVAIFSTPERDALRGTGCMHSPNEAHVREWNLDEFRRLLEWAAFDVARQVVLPVARLPWSEELLRLATPAGLLPRKWRSCQVAVCTVRGTD